MEYFDFQMLKPISTYKHCLEFISVFDEKICKTNRLDELISEIQMYNITNQKIIQYLSNLIFSIKSIHNTSIQMKELFENMKTDHIKISNSCFEILKFIEKIIQETDCERFKNIIYYLPLD